MKTSDLFLGASLLALTFTTHTGCDLGEKNVGSETESDDAGNDDGSGDDGGGTDGGTAGGTSMGSADDGGSGDTGGVWDPCADAACGEPCSVCPPDDETCVEPAVETVCDGAGMCVDQGGDICAGPSLEPMFEVGLTNTFGCADIFMYAVNDNDTVMLSLSDSELVAMTEAAMAPQQFMLDFADGGTLSLTVDVGQNVDEYACNDAISMEPLISESWTAVSGTVVFDVDVPDEFGNTNASATLTDVVIETPEGDQLTIESFTFTDIGVGWLPG